MKPTSKNLPSCAAAAAILLLLWPVAAPAQKEPQIETLTIPEVSEKVLSLDQKTFRLKFHYRQAVNQIDTERYWVRLFDLDYNHVCVEFPKESLSFFKKLVSEQESYKKYRRGGVYSPGSADYVYVTARGITNETKPAWWTPYSYNGKTAPMMVLDAIGKSASKNISGETKYKW